MSPFLCFDVESIPLESSLALPYPEAERNPPGNYKKDEAIAAWREKDRAEWAEGRVKECSLNPRLGRILCIGYQGVGIGCLTAPTEADEPQILREFWEMVHESTRLVTWNGLDFDARWILLRSIAHGVEPSIRPDTLRSWFRRYTVYPHFDCRAVLTNWRPETGTLGEWASFLGVEGKVDGLNGSHVYEAFKAGELEKIADYCTADVQCTAGIYQRLARYFG